MDIGFGLEKFVYCISGSKKNNVAIVIPAGPNKGLLEEHLGVLSRQGKKEFDVLVIGEMPDFVPKGLNVLRYGERQPLGSSGGFGIGQMLGHTMGYEVVINADVDCFPSSNGFVEGLVEIARRENKAVLPISDEQGIKNVYCINRYGAVPRAALEKTGFEYVIFFKGAEDIDLQLRLEADGLLCTTSELSTTHPYLSMAIFEVASRGSKYMYYYRAGIAILGLGLYRAICALRAKEALVWTGRIVYTYCYNFVFSALVSRTLFCTMLDGFTLNLGKKYGKEEFSIPQAQLKENAQAFFLEMGFGREKQTSYFEEWKENIGLVGKIMRRVGHVGKFLGLLSAKGDYFKPSEKFMESNELFVPYLMFLKPVWYKGNAHTWNKGALWLPVGIALLAVSLPLLPIVVAVSLLKIFLRGDYPPRAGKAEKMLKNFEGILMRE